MTRGDDLPGRAQYSHCVAGVADPWSEIVASSSAWKMLSLLFCDRLEAGPEEVHHSNELSARESAAIIATNRLYLAHGHTHWIGTPQILMLLATRSTESRSMRNGSDRRG